MKKLKYVSKIEFVEPIVPSSTLVPRWYQEIPTYVGDKLVVKDYSKNISIKNCMPFLDTLISGYMLVTYQDIQVTQVNGLPTINWLIEPDPVVSRDAPPGVPIPHGCSKSHFGWLVPIHYKTPKGFSVLITHPINRFDLPFTTLSAIIDCDKGMYGGLLPFYLKEGFEGVIPKGTPFAQIIPFTKESWGLEKDNTLSDIARKMKYLSGSVVKGWYRKSIWVKPSYK